MVAMHGIRTPRSCPLTQGSSAGISGLPSAFLPRRMGFARRGVGEMSAGEPAKLELRIEDDQVRFYLNGRIVPDGGRLDLLEDGDTWVSGRFNMPKKPGDRPTLFCAGSLPERRNTATVRFVRLGPESALRWSEPSAE